MLSAGKGWGYPCQPGGCGPLWGKYPRGAITTGVFTPAPGVFAPAPGVPGPKKKSRVDVKASTLLKLSV